MKPGHKRGALALVVIEVVKEGAVPVDATVGRLEL
jgi:hypothetical protein